MREPPIYIHDIKAETKVWNFTSPEEAKKKENTKKKKNMLKRGILSTKGG